MGFILSVSSDTVDSSSQRLPELFNWHTQAIEIGNLGYDGDLEFLMGKSNRSGLKVGFHCPLYSLDSRYGFLLDDDTARDELRRACRLASDWGVSYIVIHFPYMWDTSGRNLGIQRVRRGLEIIKTFEGLYKVPIICEPKLGPRKDPSAFIALMAISEARLPQWNLSLCLDVGDIYLACRLLKYPYQDMISQLAPWCRVVHLHHVWLGGRKYYWSPVAKQGNVPILDTMDILKNGSADIYAVLQHCPHRTGSRESVADGINWLLENTGPWVGREECDRGKSTQDEKYAWGR